MVFIIIPRRRATVYSCPHCRAPEKFFFSVWPVLRPDWTCRRCRKKFKMAAGSIGANWAWVAALWSMPLCFLLGGVLITALVLVQAAKGAVHNIPLAVLASFVLGGLAFALAAVVPALLIGAFAGRVYGASVAGGSPKPR